MIRGHCLAPVRGQGGSADNCFGLIMTIAQSSVLIVSQLAGGEAVMSGVSYIFRIFSVSPCNNLTRIRFCLSHWTVIECFSGDNYRHLEVYNLVIIFSQGLLCPSQNILEEFDILFYIILIITDRDSSGKGKNWLRWGIYWSGDKKLSSNKNISDFIKYVVVQRSMWAWGMCII